LYDALHAVIHLYHSQRVIDVVENKHPFEIPLIESHPWTDSTILSVSSVSTAAFIDVEDGIRFYNRLVMLAKDSFCLSSFLPFSQKMAE